LATIDSAAYKVARFQWVTTILNIACSSAAIQRLWVDRPESGLQRMRAQLHLFLSAPMASLKSAVLTQAQSAFGGIYQLGLTYPALVGTIDKNSGELTGSLAWAAKDSVLYVDEFVSSQRIDVLIKAFLPLLSDQIYTRSIGLKSVDKSSRSNGNYYLVHKGRIELKVRFAAVFASMYSLKMFAKYVSHAALLDRCIPIQYEVTNEERDAVARGKPVFDAKPYRCPKEVTVGRKDFERVYDFWKKNSRLVHDVRALDDCLRAFAVTQKHDEAVYRFIIDSHGGLDEIKKEIEQERASKMEWNQRRYYGGVAR
jgi:hypothetical protein